MNKVTLFLFLSLILDISACQPSAPEAEQDFCQSLETLGESLTNLKSTSTQNDQDALQSAWDDTVDSYGEVKDGAEQMRDVKLNDLALAWRNLEITVGAALGVSSTSDSIQGIEKAWNDVKAAYDELLQVNCKSQ